MRATISIDSQDHGNDDDQTGTTTVRREDGTRIVGTWEVRGGKGHGTQLDSCTVPGLSDEDAQTALDLATWAFEGDDRWTADRRDLPDGDTEVAWADLAAALARAV